jgi:hypothetical protein
LFNNEVRTGKYVSDNFSLQKGVKQGGALSPMLLYFDTDYAIRKVQEVQVGLKVYEMRQLRLMRTERLKTSQSLNI